MGTVDRQPYLTAMVLDQAFLDDAHDNLTNQLEMIVDIGAPSGDVAYTNPIGNEIEIYQPRHGFVVGHPITISKSSDPGLIGTFPVIFSGFSENYFRINKGSAVAPGTGTINYGIFLHLSDRNKYVGPTFYEARLTFPTITRTIGEYLTPTLEFSQLQLELNNVDGRFNNLLPAGEDYEGWPGKSVSVKIGLRDVASTYTEIFRGSITDEGGFQRSIKSVTITARNDFDKINADFPVIKFDVGAYPDIEPEVENTVKALIYGDWTVNVQPDGASIPATVVNGFNPLVNGDTGNTVDIEFVISENDNTFFDASEVYLFKSDVFYKFDVGDVTTGAGNKSFTLAQSGSGGTTQVGGAPYSYAKGDKFFVKVQGLSLGAYSDNIVSQAKHILLTYGGVQAGDFDSSWDAYRDKSTPAESAIYTFKSRVWIKETRQALTFALSLLEQVRLEAFIDRNLKIKITSLHLDDFVAYPAFSLENWDVVAGTFTPRVDYRNNFNRARGSYNYLPNRNENFLESPTFRNDPAIAQWGKEVGKLVVFPNLYDENTVSNQVKEILKLSSSFSEIIEVSLTWRAMLLDIGEFVKINVRIQGIEFNNVPAMIRDIGYDPAGIRLPMRLWSFQMLEFAGYAPGFSGVTGGTAAIITQE